MLRISELATPVNKDGGRDLGGLLGAIIGACVGFWALPSSAAGIESLEIMACVFGAVLGLAIGLAIGGVIDSWLAPKVEQTIDNAPTEQQPRNRGKMQ